MIISNVGIFASMVSQASGYLLDSYSAVTGLSLRKISGSYSGNVIKVRRSSDNTLQDIGFSGDELDTTALTTFVGAGNGYVHTWYDQSPFGAHYTSTMANTSTQPLIVSGGTVLTDEGKPAIRFIASAATVLSASTTVYGGGKLDMYIVANQTAAWSSTTSANTALLFSRQNIPTWRMVRNSVVVQSSSSHNGLYTNDGYRRLINFYIDSDEKRTVTYNNSEPFKANTTAGTLSLTSVLATHYIGRTFTYSTNLFDGYMQEMIIFTGLQSSKAAIKTNVKDYFEIPDSAAPPLPYYERFGTAGNVSGSSYFVFPPSWIYPVGTAVDSAYDIWRISNNDTFTPCNVLGSSGGAFLLFRNSLEYVDNSFDVQLPAISTAGKTNITVSFNQIRQPNAPEAHFAWNTNSGVTDTVYFTNVPDNNTWQNVSFVLNAGAEDADRFTSTLLTSVVTVDGIPEFSFSAGTSMDASTWQLVNNATANSALEFWPNVAGAHTVVMTAGDDSSMSAGDTVFFTENSGPGRLNFSWTAITSDDSLVESMIYSYANGNAGSISGLTNLGGLVQTGYSEIAINISGGFALATNNDGLITTQLFVGNAIFTPIEQGGAMAFDDIRITGT